MNFMGFFFQPINLAGTALAVILSISIIKIFAGRLTEKMLRVNALVAAEGKAEIVNHMQLKSTRLLEC